MKGMSKGNGGGGHDPLVKRISKHPIGSKDALYIKDAKKGCPAKAKQTYTI